MGGTYCGDGVKHRCRAVQTLEMRLGGVCDKQCVCGFLSSRIGEVEQEGITASRVFKREQERLDVRGLIKQNGVAAGWLDGQTDRQGECLTVFCGVEVALHHHHVVQRTVYVGAGSYQTESSQHNHSQ